MDECEIFFTLSGGVSWKRTVVYAEVKCIWKWPDEKHPFFVMLNGMKVEVLGTSFNVNSYADENYAEVTLVEGTRGGLRGRQEL